MHFYEFENMILCSFKNTKCTYVRTHKNLTLNLTVPVMHNMYYIM